MARFAQRRAFVIASFATRFSAAVDDSLVLLQQQVHPHDVAVDEAPIPLMYTRLPQVVMQGLIAGLHPEPQDRFQDTEDDDIEPWRNESLANETYPPVTFEPVPKMDIDAFRDVDIERARAKAMLIRLRQNRSGSAPEMRTSLAFDDTVRCASDDPESDAYCMLQPQARNETLSLTVSGFNTSYEDWADVNITIKVNFHYPWYLAAGALFLKDVHATCPLCRRHPSDSCNITVMGQRHDLTERLLCSELAGKDGLEMKFNLTFDNQTARFLPNGLSISAEQFFNNSNGQIAHTQAWGRLSSTEDIYHDLTRKQGREIFENYHLTKEEEVERKQVEKTDKAASELRTEAKRAKEKAEKALAPDGATHKSSTKKHHR